MTVGLKYTKIWNENILEMKKNNRKRTHISAALYIIISLTTLFLAFFPLILILLLSCLLHKTEIDGQIPMQGGSVFLFWILLYFLQVLHLEC